MWALSASLRTSYRKSRRPFSRSSTSPPSPSLAPGGTGQTIFHSKNFLVGVSKFLGRHSLKFGFDYRRINNDGISFPNTSFSFDNSFTRASQVPTAANGADVASMLLGLPSGGTASRVVGVQQFVNYYGGYVHDDFRINDSVTLNFGIRYDNESGLRAVDNAVIVGFDRRDVVEPDSGHQILACGVYASRRIALRGLEWKPHPNRAT
ncbi:MAG: hypothetical protein U5J83_03945 [Bryobacterales bacterium]|nr:hypothetical protein [Bryobacterales bacterium]